MDQSKKSSKANKPAISLVIAVHDEGRLLHHTLRSVRSAIEYAKTKKIQCETIVIAYAPSPETEQYLARFSRQVIRRLDIHKTGHNDISLARNIGIKQAKGEYIGIIKAGDLVAANWLGEAATYLKAAQHRVIVHPQYVFSFGKKDQIRKIKATTDKTFAGNILAEGNCFCSVMMTTRQVAQQFLYKPADGPKAYDYPDWLWACDTLAAGIPHEIIDQTMYAERWRESDTTIRRAKGLLRGTPYLANDHKFRPQPVTEAQEFKPIQNRLLGGVRKSLDWLHHSRIGQAVRRVHPRLAAYMTSLHNETLHLFRPVSQPASQPIPRWLDEAILALHKLDLSIYLSSFLRQHIEYVENNAGAFADAHWELVGKIGQNTDLLWLVPYLKNGGAEREVAYLVNELLRLKPKERIKILATDPSDSPWAKKLNPKVSFLTPPPSFFQLDLDERAYLIAMLCVQLKPRKLHLMNSMAGYMALERYAAAISESTRMFITIFSIDRTPEGRQTHMFTEYMQSSIDYLDKVFTDNETVVKQLSELMAIDRNKFSVHYQPAPTASLKPGDANDKFTKKTINILWAGRMDRQKRPDILVKIAAMAYQKNLSLNFYAFGSPAFDEVEYFELVKNSPHIFYRGTFENGLLSLPLEEFDIFILTSEWEGLPNILLEAIVGGLLVIAPNVGGVAELIENGQTGYLVEQYDDVNGYIEAITAAVKNGQQSRNIIENARSLVIKKHSQAAYEQQIAAEQDYIS